MTDRPSSSRGDRSSDRSGQDSSRQSARDQHPIMWSQPSDRQNRQADQQASTSSGLDNGKQKGEYREQRQRNDVYDEAEKRFRVILEELKNFFGKKRKVNPDHLEKLLGFWKSEFSKTKNEHGRKQIIEELADFLRKEQPDIYNGKEQIEIDKKLGYLLKNRDEELKKVRMSVIEFIEQKIENESNKREVFLNWSTALDTYCTNNQLVTSGVYQNVIDDTGLCYEQNQNKIAEKGADNNYIGNNSQIYESIKKINESLYTERERAQLLRLENHEREIQDFQDLLVQEQERGTIQHSLNTIMTDNDELEPQHALSQSHEEAEMQRALLQSHEEAEMQRALSQSREEAEMQHALSQSHEEAEMQRALSQSREEAEIQQALAQSPEQLSNQGFNANDQLNHYHRLQSQEVQRFLQRYEEIDVSHMASPQIIDVVEVLRQQLERIWRCRT